jgi:hypothetical protein
MEKDKIKLNEFIENPEHYFVLLKPALGGFKFLSQFFALEFCLIFQIQKARF